jgi:hypothetical protein
MSEQQYVPVGQTAAKPATNALTVRLLPAEMARLRQYGQDHDTKIAQVVHDAIREYLDRRQPWATVRGKAPPQPSARAPGPAASAVRARD